MPSRRWWGATLLWLCAFAQATDTLGYLEQTFYFNYNVPSQAVPVPVTTQCETIHLTWGRGAGTGYVTCFATRVDLYEATFRPDPVAPYFLQIYTSAFVFPFIVSVGSGLSFDWEVPFNPGTLYQICMFDANGNTGASFRSALSRQFIELYPGGCEAIYTMIANTTTTPSCSLSQLGFPLGPLDVDATTTTGSLSQYGWVDQCTDIQVTPKNGTPPYIFTVAPTLHPPHNETGTDQSPMNWTVNLSWGSPFFISVVDADMNFWAYGPLHSGKGSSVACLSGSKGFESRITSPGTAVASGIGGLLLGLIVGAVGVFALSRYRRRRAKHAPLLNSSGSEGYLDPYLFTHSSTAPAHYKAVPTTHAQDTSSTLSPSPSYMPMQRMQSEGTHYQIEPFAPPGERRHSSYGSELNAESQRGASPTTPVGGNIYVVHHDAGRAPVTVYHQEGTEVVELPPRYLHGTSASDDLAEPRGVSAVPNDSRTTIGTYSVNDIVSPPRRPNRPRKP
ncbi:hypothetical protein MVEN_01915400 [Mycena venus]|uniref:Uncharacterized protein n=1 Tax=Mycena venus TaxID=2733690 RepID=A0A8H6XF66_9AGAR|nr:hypothetical protein MVEN_01915400 [Mycena venus]